MAIRPVKLKLVTRFPATILGGDGITVVQSGGAVTISVDPADMPGLLGLQEEDSDLQALADNTSNGFWVRVAEGTGATRTITGTANEVTVTNGDGVSANPVLSLPAALTLTGKTIAGGTFTNPSVGTLTVTGSGAITGALTVGGALAVTGAIDTDAPATTVANLGLRTQETGSATYYVGSAPATVTISNASPGVVTWTAHGRAANDPVAFSTTGALPTGLTAGTVYYVKTVLSANTFTVSATPGGAAINTSSAGSGTHKSWTGNDTTGTGTTGNPFMTLQRAWDYLHSLVDTRGQFVTIRVRAAHQRSSSYVLNAYGQFVGQQNEVHITIMGDSATAGDQIIQGEFDGFRFEQFVSLRILNFRIISTAGGGIAATQYGWVSYSNIDFGTCATQHVLTAKFAMTFDGGGCTISGNAPVHNYVTDRGMSFETTGTTTLTNTPNFSTAYVVADVGGEFVQHTKTYSGASVGVRFIVRNRSRISVETLTKLPGDTAGQIVDPLSIVVSGDSADTTALYNDWTAFTPTVTSSGGTITTVGTVSGQYQKVGNVIHFRMRITITTLGTASGRMIATLPFNDKTTGSGHASGFVDVGTRGVIGLVNVDAANKLSMIRSDTNAFPVASDGETVRVAGTYEAA